MHPPPSLLLYKQTRDLSFFFFYLGVKKLLRSLYPTFGLVFDGLEEEDDDNDDDDDDGMGRKEGVRGGSVEEGAHACLSAWFAWLARPAGRLGGWLVGWLVGF